MIHLPHTTKVCCISMTKVAVRVSRELKDTPALHLRCSSFFYCMDPDNRKTCMWTLGQDKSKVFWAQVMFAFISKISVPEKDDRLTTKAAGSLVWSFLSYWWFGKLQVIIIHPSIFHLFTVIPFGVLSCWGLRQLLTVSPSEGHTNTNTNTECHQSTNEACFLD